MAIFDLLNNVMSAVDKKTPICAIYTDMTKAFDYVNHKILLDKLHCYGIRGNILKLLESYLSNRLQCTEITRVCTKTKMERTYVSNFRNIKYGVPQGSVLGPPLFLIYINDLPKVTQQQMILFADDSTAIVKCKDLSTYQIDINNTLSDIINWLNMNNLIINLKKTKVMHFHQRIEVPKICVNYNGNEIEEVKVSVFLGIHIDNNLNWKAHIEQLCKKINKSAYALFQLARKVNIDALLVAYHGLVASLLRYGIIFWGNSPDKGLLFKAQKRCIRAMCGLKTDDSCAPYFKSLKILTLPAIYILEISIFVKTNPNLFEKITMVRNVPIRSQYKNSLSNYKCKTALVNKSVLGMAPRIYNKIPDAMKELNFTQFKKKMKMFLIDKCYYTIDEYLNDELI